MFRGVKRPTQQLTWAVLMASAVVHKSCVSGISHLELAASMFSVKWTVVIMSWCCHLWGFLTITNWHKEFERILGRKSCLRENVVHRVLDSAFFQQLMSLALTRKILLLPLFEREFLDTAEKLLVGPCCASLSCRN